jgi:polysaccharide biosynthesis protein PelD
MSDSATPFQQTTQQTEDAAQAAPRRLLGFRRVALIELALFFGVALWVDWALGNGQRFESVQPHPFWIPVLLLAIQYGTNEGVLAALAAAAALRGGNLPEQMISQDLYQYLYAMTREPILWLVAGVLVGELRMRQIR